MTDFEQLSAVFKRFETLQATPGGIVSGDLILGALQALNLKPTQLATALEVSPASVSRWVSGSSSPHQRHVRALQDMLRGRMLHFTEPHGIDIHGRKIAISTFDAFFRRAKEAKIVYVFKNILGFQAGMNPSIKQQLKDLFTFNPDLKICYGFSKDSEAAMTFLNFRRELASDWPRNIHWKEVPIDDEIMNLLGSVFASPFIIEHHDGRVDVLLETPVKILRTLNEYDLATHTSIFVELADTHKHQMWMQWRGALEKIEWQSTPIKITVSRICIGAIVEVRDAAYELNSSGSDEFDSTSFFVVAEIEGRVIGSIRLTPTSKSSPLRKWVRGKNPFPEAPGVVELTRGVVHPSKQHLGIYKRMMLRSVQESARAGFSRAVAAVELDFPLKNFLHEIGFKNIGKAVPFDDTPREGTLSQPMMCELTNAQSLWEEVAARLPKRGVNIVDV